MMDCKADSLSMDCGAGKTGAALTVIPNVPNAAVSLTGPRRFCFCPVFYF
jgi:hypothetical protein